MPDIVHVNYAQTGKSATTNFLGIREMQEKAYQARDAQYLLLKAPPASGKSRALMFVALDKLINWRPPPLYPFKRLWFLCRLGNKRCL